RAWWRGRRWWWWPSPRRWAPLCLAVGEGGTWGPSPRPHAKQPHQLAVRPSVPQNQQLSSSSSSSSSCQIALPASLPGLSSSPAMSFPAPPPLSFLGFSSFFQLWCVWSC
uniref:Uncharacterized protein n=1 Tax=Aegilops tauschii subsp. strangulata TaxID=200361 RepID=A0A453GD54_AEGTS